MFVTQTVEQYEELAATVELTVQQLVQAHNYNTVGNLLRFYEEFRSKHETNVEEFFRRYEPPITPQHYTCVGLSLELLRRLDLISQRFPKVAGKFYIVSCEEAIDDLPEYIRSDPSAATSEKEHVMVALQLLIAGRPGLLLLDPGYHVARVITVMADHVYPHTGWFTQSDEPHVKKEYNYSFCENTDYVQWMDRETRGGIKELSESVIFISRPYETPVEVTERRNLVYNFRSLLARNTKGHLMAGVYFPVKVNPSCTIFYQGNAQQKLRLRLNISDVASWGVKERDAITNCNHQLNLPSGELDSLLKRVSVLVRDRDFVRQMLDINREINTISIEN